MRKHTVCLNCRKPISGKTQKYCSRCAPHVIRMRGKARSKSTWLFWKPTTKFCKSCHKMKPVTDFGLVAKPSGTLKRRHECVTCHRLDTRSRKTGVRLGKSMLSDNDWRMTLYAFGNRCAYCGGAWEHRDHLIPLAMGGEFTKMNIVPACKNCNLKKRAKNPLCYPCAPEAYMRLLETHL